MTRGEKIKSLLLDIGMEPQELADRLGITVSYIHKLMKDQVRNPSNRILKGICEILGCIPEYLGCGSKVQLPEKYERIYANELLDFVLNIDNKPLIVFAMHLSKLDLEAMSDEEKLMLMKTAEYLNREIAQNKRNRNFLPIEGQHEAV